MKRVWVFQNKTWLWLFGMFACFSKDIIWLSVLVVGSPIRIPYEPSSATRVFILEINLEDSSIIMVLPLSAERIAIARFLLFRDVRRWFLSVQIFFKKQNIIRNFWDTEICYLSNPIETVNDKITYRTNKIPLVNHSGVYKLTCMSCPKGYLGLITRSSRLDPPDTIDLSGKWKMTPFS